MSQSDLDMYFAKREIDGIDEIVSREEGDVKLVVLTIGECFSKFKLFCEDGKVVDATHLQSGQFTAGNLTL